MTAWQAYMNANLHGFTINMLAICINLVNIQHISTMANVSTNSRYDYLFKVLLCGDSGVGKTSMLYRQVSDKMNDAYTATIG